jgi:hypothetical protein
MLVLYDVLEGTNLKTKENWIKKFCFSFSI